MILDGWQAKQATGARKVDRMPDCQHCKYAEWDYDDFNFGGHVRQWFLTGCRKDVEDVEKCAEFEEATHEENPNII